MQKLKSCKKIVFGEELEKRFCYRRSVRGDVERCEGCAKSYIDENNDLFCVVLQKAVWPNWTCKQWEMAF
jgi:hypothetical protein